MKARPKTKITPVEAVEIGIELMMLKACVKHGEFMPRLELLGYSLSEAQKFMRTARKFHGISNARLLEAAESVTKLNELLTLEDDEIDTLKAGGEVQGITLDSIKTMTVLELRDAIRGVSALRKVEMLTLSEAKMLQIHRLNTRNVQDVTDKNDPTAPAAVAQPEDLFSTLSPPVPFSAPIAPLEIPKASGWHVAGLQLVNPIGTWRMACTHVNQGTRYANVTFRPAPARAGYRADSSLVEEQRVLRAYCERAKEVQDVNDKNAPFMAPRNDFFSNQTTGAAS